jgi:hypothetical protein
MKRARIVGMVVVLTLALVPPAIALDFKFGGEYRVRFYSYSNFGFDENNPNGANLRGAQVRVRPRFDASDDNGNITATLRLEIGDVEFGDSDNVGVGRSSGGGLGTDGINVETKWAYIDAAFPFGVPLRVRAGLQPVFLPKGLIIDDDVAGVRAYGTSGPIGYDLFWYRTDGAPSGAFPTTANACTNAGCTTTATVLTSTAVSTRTNGFAANASPNIQNAYDNNTDFLQGRLDFNAAKWLNAGVYGIYGRNAATGATVGGGAVKTWVFGGLTTMGDLGFMKYDFDVVFGRANGVATNVDASGYGFDAGVHFPIGPAVINVGGSWFTGDKQEDGISEAFPGISPSWHGPGNMMFELIGNGGVFDTYVPTQAGPTGLWTLAASVEYRPVKALWLKLGYMYASFVENDANCAYVSPTRTQACVGNSTSYGKLAGETSLGHEFMLRADWDVWTGFKVQGTAGALIPKEGDTTLEFALQMLYNF